MAESGQRRRRSARLAARSQQATSEEYEAVFDNYLEEAAGPLPGHGPDSGSRKRVRKGDQNQAHDNHLSSNREFPLCQKDVSGQPSAESMASQMPDKRLLNHVIDILKKRDADDIFAEPVDPTEVEGYYAFVKEPMDFSTLKEKLEQGSYRSLEHFEQDVFLIFNNAMSFNGERTFFYRQARSMRKLARDVFRSLRADPENLELESSLSEKIPGRKPECGDRSSDSAAPHQLRLLASSTSFGSLFTSLFYEASRGMIPAPPSQLNPEPVLNNPEVNKFMENDSFLALMLGPASNLDRTYFDEPEMHKENPVDQPSDEP